MSNSPIDHPSPPQREPLDGHIERGWKELMLFLAYTQPALLSSEELIAITVMFFKLAAKQIGREE